MEAGIESSVGSKGDAYDNAWSSLGFKCLREFFYQFKIDMATGDVDLLDLYFDQVSQLKDLPCMPPHQTVILFVQDIVIIM